MKLEINIDVTAIVTQAIQTYINNNLVIVNTPGSSELTVTTGITDNIKIDLGKDGVDPTRSEPTKTAEELVKVEDPEVSTADTSKSSDATSVDWEFAPKPGRRRSKEEMAMHDRELELGRRLTPEEKGESQAYVEIQDERTEKAKEETKKKIRIGEIAEEAMSKVDAEDQAAEQSRDSVNSMFSSGVPKDSEEVAQAASESPESSIEDSDDGRPFALSDSTKVEDEPTTPVAEDIGGIENLFK